MCGRTKRHIPTNASSVRLFPKYNKLPYLKQTFRCVHAHMTELEVSYIALWNEHAVDSPRKQHTCLTYCLCCVISRTVKKTTASSAKEVWAVSIY